MKNILLIDDNAENRENFAEILQMDGYHVSVADDGKSALNMISSVSPDLILCDVQMPGISGFELKQKLNELQLQKVFAPVPFVFLSACSAPQDLEQAKKLGASAYLVKPVEPMTVVETIRKIFSTDLF